MKHFNKLFSGIVAGITVAVLGVTSIPTNAALSQSVQDFWDSFKTYTDVNMSGAFDALTDAINYSTTVSRRIWGNDGGHGGGSHSRSGAITTFVDSPAAVFNSDGFADAAAALLVPYAKASTGKDGVTNVITEVTVPQQYDFTGMCSFHNSNNTYHELFQIHIKFNGYRYTQDFFPDCAAYFSRIDDAGVVQTQTVYIDPTISPTFNTDYTDVSGNGLRFYARFYIDGAWSVYGIQFKTNSKNSIEYTHDRWSANTWWKWNEGGYIGNPFGYPYYLTDALTNDAAVYTLIRQQEEKEGGGFKIPIGVGGAAAGAIINVDSLLGGFTFDSLLGGLSLQFDDLLGEFSANLGDSINQQYDNIYSDIANHNELWNSQERQNLFELYNYLEPLPPSTGGGVPDDWLNSYPTVTTAWSIEPYNGTYPNVTMPTLANPVVTGISDIFDSSGFVPLAVTLVTVGIVLSLF